MSVVDRYNDFFHDKKLVFSDLKDILASIHLFSVTRRAFVRLWRYKYFVIGCKDNYLLNEHSDHGIHLRNHIKPPMTQ